MRFFILMICLFVAGCQSGSKNYSDMNISELQSKYKTYRNNHFYVLNDLIKKSVEAGNLEEAAKYAQESLALAPLYKENWNYGNAIFDANMALGLKNLESGKIKDAKANLIAAGKTPGSPQLNSFGLVTRDMTLVKKMLEMNERDAVLDFLKLTSNFWKSDGSENKTLTTWIKQVSQNETPNFEKFVE